MTVRIGPSGIQSWSQRRRRVFAESPIFDCLCFENVSNWAATTMWQHLHVNDASLIPAVWRAPDSFSVLRLESECGMADRITKLASAPALLVSVSIRSLAISDYQLWVDDKLVPTPFIPAFRSNVLDLDAKPRCWAGRAFDYVHYHVPCKALDDIAASFAVGSVAGYKLAVVEEDLVLSQLTKSLLPYIGREGLPSPLSVDYLQLILGAHLVQRYARLAKGSADAFGGIGALAKTPRHRVAQRESRRPDSALRLGERMRPFD